MASGGQMNRRRESELTDAALVGAVRAGDERAFEALLLRHEGRVLRLLRLLEVSPADREDVAQEVFVRVFRHIGGFRSGRPFEAWVYRITVNAAHDHRRHSRRRDRREVAWDEACDAAPDPRHGAEAIFDRKQARRRMESALAGLSERERAVFVLCHFEGLDTPQVARALGISSITVRRHQSRARDRLRAILSAYPQEKLSAG